MTVKVPVFTCLLIRSIDHNHNITGRIETIRDRRGNATVYLSYDNRNLLLSVVDAAGNAVMSNVYDSRNTNLLTLTLTLTLTDALMNTTTFFWDAGIGSGCSTGASLGTQDALLNRSTVSATIDVNRNRTEFNYDAPGNLTRARFPDLLTETMGDL